MRRWTPRRLGIAARLDTVHGASLVTGGRGRAVLRTVTQLAHSFHHIFLSNYPIACSCTPSLWWNLLSHAVMTTDIQSWKFVQNCCSFSQGATHSKRCPFLIRILARHFAHPPVPARYAASRQDTDGLSFSVDGEDTVQWTLCITNGPSWQSQVLNAPLRKIS